MENQTIRMKILREKYLKKMLNSQFLKVKNSLFELEKYFTELKDREIEELFYKTIIVSKDNMDKFEEQEMKKIRSIKKKICDGLIKGVMTREKKSKMIREKSNDKIVNDIWTLFETKKKKKIEKRNHNERIIKDRIIRDIITFFKLEEDYYEPKRVSNFWNNNYIEYDSNGDKNRNLPLDRFLIKIKSYLRNIIINLQNSDRWKIQLTIAINYISSNNPEVERVVHLSSGSIKFTPYSDVNDVIDKFFKSLRSGYRENLETSMKGSDFIFDSVQLMYRKCHEVNFNVVVTILVLHTG